MAETDHNTARTTDREKRLSRWDYVLLYIGILGTGLLLFWMGGGYPSPAWSHLVRLLHEPVPSHVQETLIIAQAGCLLAAWGLLLILILRLTAHCMKKLFTKRAQQSPIRQHIAGIKLQQAGVKAQGTPFQHTHPDMMSTHMLPHLQRARKTSTAYQGHSQDPSRPLQEEDFPDPLPVLPLSSAIFGEALQVTVASCSDEGMLHVPTTKAYFLTDTSGENGTAHPFPISMIALVDHLPADEPGYTNSCRAIESMRDMVIHVWMDMQHGSEEALAALFTEQVQKVMHVIGQQSQGDEAFPAMAAVLIIGSTMHVEKTGDTRVYLCHALEGFSQLTQAFQVVRPLKAGTSTVSSSHSLQTRGKKHDRGSGSPPAFPDERKAVSLLAGDRILLCSDGVWSVLHASYLEHIIRSVGPDPADMCAALLQATRKSGSTDPVSIIAVQCQGAKAFLP